MGFEEERRLKASFAILSMSKKLLEKERKKSSTILEEALEREKF